ncbi:MAG TPA: DNA translocase FtsK [Longilinea sp.]|nr:DNA translocase FtsK [Longilinea sp.]
MKSEPTRSKSTSRTNRASLQVPQDEIEPTSGERMPFSLDRFGWDIVGIILFAIALMTLLGLLGLTQGGIITPWVDLLRLGMGVGSYFAVVFFVFLGFAALRNHFTQLPGIPFKKVLAWEGLAFCIMAMLAIFSGLELENEVLIAHGGVIGWGIASLVNFLLPMPFSTLLFLLLIIVFLINGIGIPDTWKRAMRDWLAGGESNTRSQLSVPSDGTSPAPVRPKAVNDISPEERASASLNRDGRLPPLDLLLHDPGNRPDEEAIREAAAKIEQTLAEFGVPTRVVGYRVGPTVTQYAVEPGLVEKLGPDGEMVQQKVRVAAISSLQNDLALALAAQRLRIEAPVPGRPYVGIEVPNTHISIVRLRSMLESDAFVRQASPLAFALGRDVAGQAVAADLSRMPHLLIAGTTGSGKSVCIQALTVCLVMNNTPDTLRVAMIDPKMVELARFNGLPHLLGQVETQPDRMVAVLRWALAEMDRRYRILEDAHARDLDTYNAKMQRKKEPTLPRIVVLIDELADLMMQDPEQTEPALVRLAQMARAVGIHLVVATQRPSTDVVTGLIKANFPARIAFSVATAIDSRVILDVNGAEKLLGKGDMLFLNPEAGTPMRAQGAIVTDPEVTRVVEFWQKWNAGQTELEPAPWESMIESTEEGGDDLLEQAIEVVRTAQHASASLLQRRLRIGYPRAARLIDELEEQGVVGPAVSGGREREVLISPDEEDADEGE